MFRLILWRNLLAEGSTMKKLLLLITVFFISIFGYAEFTDVDRLNLALAAREVEEIEDNSYLFFTLDWVNLFGQIDAIQLGLQDTLPLIYSELLRSADYTNYIFQDVREIWFNLIDYMPQIVGELNTTAINTYQIVNELYSIREHQYEKLDIPLSELKPYDYKESFSDIGSRLQSINQELDFIQTEGLTVNIAGDPHVTAHVENLPDFDTGDLQKAVEAFNEDFENYVDSFQDQSVSITHSPLWRNVNPDNEDDFIVEPNRNISGSFFQNLIEMISFLQVQNASLNKSAYLIYRNVSGKTTEEERDQLEEELNGNISDIKGRMSELKLEVDDTKLNFNFESNQQKLEIDEIFRQFPQGSNPQSVLFYMPSFGDFPAQTIQVDISALSSFIEKLRIFVRLSYVILLAFVIWSLYKWLFPLLLYLVNFIKKLVSIQ